jgi:hypothetical protein
MRIGIGLIILLFFIIGAVVKIVNKRRMRSALGRDVGNHELTSLNSWMDVVEKEDEKRAKASPGENK